MALGKAILVLAATPLLLATAQPQTLAPRVTGSMYNGNNVQPPKLPASQEPAGISANVSGQSQTQDQTTSNRSQGRRSAEGGGG